MIKRSILALALASALALPLGSALAVSGAPVAENLELTTYRNVSVGGRLAAVDPDALSGDVFAARSAEKQHQTGEETACIKISHI